ncbi:phosphate ABC transporter permease PstA [Corynebacterium freneyi]|uniref:Phosphate transport system permease protein PstA n=1 Tax=Corynebacterium freneyi TaxID=134034 RepID=A0ABS4U508_9CORY|nr:phosphate ABC transporter permease PstA [Corynebacterium freneyi]MBP2331727.1 phosphate transport system permease protein [Corynebacterium freneyi]QXA51830.1 phosphate ABC transporter permease PstA [Corynebacterium freneyi]UBI02023.1 phosphate ABC transporter permease PstA [Corynebacterium freneyi]WJZ06150.1 Phosphate transport system permease protein PstA [Corynebacterium freneyi]
MAIDNQAVIDQDPAAKVSTSDSAFTPIKNSRKVGDKFATVIIYASMALALIPLGWVLYEVITRGFPMITSASWWTTSQLGVTVGSESGGVAHAIIGTLVQALVTSIITVPFGIFVAIYLVEYAGNSRLGKITTFMVDILSGVPSIVASLFIYSMWVVMFGMSRSGFAVSLALVLLMLPIVVRNTEEMLRVVPNDLREASYALGVPKWKTIAKIVLPTALSGIVTGIMLSIARVMGESAPMLILVATSRIITWNPFGQSQSSLPLFMLDMYKAGNTGAAFDKMWGAALTLVLIIAVINVIARVISAKFSVKQ